MFKKLRIAIAKALNPEDTSWRSLGGGALGGSLTRNTSVANLMSNYKNWVYVCVDKIADTVSSIDIRVRRYTKDGDDEIIIDHKAALLLEKPNPFMTGRDFSYLIMAYFELTGNAYILKDMPKNPTKLH